VTGTVKDSPRDWITEDWPGWVRGQALRPRPFSGGKICHVGMGTAFDLAGFDRFVDEQGIPMRIIRKRSPWIAKRLEGHVLRLEEVGTPGDLRTKEEAGAEVVLPTGGAASSAPALPHPRGWKRPSPRRG
jgi:hypothetical protein